MVGVPTNSSPRLGSGCSPVSSKRATANLLPKLLQPVAEGLMFVGRPRMGTESSTMDYAGALVSRPERKVHPLEDMVRVKNQMIARYENQEDKPQKAAISFPARTNEPSPIVGSTSLSYATDRRPRGSRKFMLHRASVRFLSHVLSPYKRSLKA